MSEDICPCCKELVVGPNFQWVTVNGERRKAHCCITCDCANEIHLAQSAASRPQIKPQVVILGRR